jgi:hypothetical protein
MITNKSRFVTNLTSKVAKILMKAQLLRQIILAFRFEFEIIVTSSFYD